MRTFFHPIHAREVIYLVAPLMVLGILAWLGLQPGTSDRPSFDTMQPLNLSGTVLHPSREEWESATEEFQAVTDGTLALGSEEMPAYWRLLHWVKSSSMEDLDRTAQTEATFDNFMQRPNQWRGKPVQLELNVCRVLAYDLAEARFGVNQLYEVWGWSDKSPGCLYVAVASELPDNMPVGASVHERVKFCGYFFKLQGYLAAGAEPRSTPLAAPLLIGRMVRSSAPPAVVAHTDEWWRIGAGLMLAISFTGSLALRSRRRKLVCDSPERLGHVDKSLLDDWLQEQAGTCDDKSKSDQSDSEFDSMSSTANDAAELRLN